MKRQGRQDNERGTATLSHYNGQDQSYNEQDQSRGKRRSSDSLGICGAADTNKKSIQ